MVARLFLRQAKRHLPSAPFHEVTRLGIDDIAERKGWKAHDLVGDDRDAGSPIDVLKNRPHVELRAYLDVLPSQVETVQTRIV